MRAIKVPAKAGEELHAYIDRCVRVASAAGDPVEAEHNGRAFIAWHDEKRRILQSLPELD